jgi:hypothetical protein
MALKNENRFTCDLKGCNVDFYYEAGKPPAAPGLPPQIPNWSPAIQVALNKAVAVTHLITGHTAFYCCDAHAIEAIGEGQHLPPMPSKITPATEADVNAAKRGIKVVEGMRQS